MTTPAGTGSDRVARDLVVRGLVQGVFFRDSTRGQATAWGVDGWVTNHADGSVRAHLEGAPDAVERLVRWAHRGPRHAAVERVEVRVVDPCGCSGFEIR
ncbi:MAG: acylphosphatase [Nocardioidaceae bacterium]